MKRDFRKRKTEGRRVGFSPVGVRMVSGQKGFRILSNGFSRSLREETFVNNMNLHQNGELTSTRV